VSVVGDGDELGTSNTQCSQIDLHPSWDIHDWKKALYW